MGEFEQKFPDNRKAHKNTPILRQVQEIELRILKIFDAICKRNGIEYFLDWGTFLGAVRHKGFIPWDDDIDLGMSVSDYKKLLPILKKELPEDIFLQTWETDKTYNNVEGIKIRDCFSNILGKEIYGKANNAGVFIEVFPLYKVPTNRFLQKLQLSLFINLISCRYFNKRKKLKYKIRYGISKLITVFIPFSKLEEKIENMYKLTKSYNYRKTLHNSSKGWNFLYLEEDVFPLKSYSFEDMKALGPNNFDKYLTMMYGNYHEPPPIDERDPTHMALSNIRINYDKMSR